MPNIDPTVRFWVGVAITIAIGLSQGTINLAHAIPDAWIPYVTVWAGIIAVAGSTVLTALNGASTTTSSRALGAASDPTIDKVVMKSKLVADTIPSDKVVAK